MKIDRFEVKFEKGFVDGARFDGLKNEYYYRPFKLVEDLKAYGVENEDLNFFFANPIETDIDGTITWVIEQHTETTFEFKELSSLNDHQRANLESRMEIVFDELQNVLNQLLQASQGDKKLLETLERIITSRPNTKLLAGFEPISKNHFPVVVGWGGDKKSNIDFDTTLRAKGKQSLVDHDLEQSSYVNQIDQNSQFLSNLFRLPILIYWLIWVLLFLLIILISYLVLPACGISGLINACNNSQVSFYDFEIKRDQLIEELKIKDSICRKQSVTKVGKHLSIEDGVNPPALEKNDEVERRLEREGVEKSSFMVTLLWDTKEDLDLQVTCPNGKKVSHLARESKINECGDLEVDTNYVNISDDPVENITLIPDHGRYTLDVISRSNSHSLPNGTEFVVVIDDGGGETTYEGTIKPTQTKSYYYER